MRERNDGHLTALSWGGVSDFLQLSQQVLGGLCAGRRLVVAGLIARERCEVCLEVFLGEFLDDGPYLVFVGWSRWDWRTA